MSLPELERFHQKAELAEQEIANLKKEIETLKKCILDNSFQQKNTTEQDITKLQQENIKLKHRVAILKRVVESSRPQSSSNIQQFADPVLNKSVMVSLYDCLYNLFENAIKAAYPDLTNPPIVLTLSSNNPKFGDYQCNSAMPIHQQLKSKGIKSNPMTIANTIMSKVEQSSIIEKLEVAGAGFINIYIKREYGQMALKNILKAGKIDPPPVKKQKIIVDFSSPNVAKEMHVGHLRSTIIGESICRTLEFLNHDVLRINHLGDWGTQFGMLIAHLQDEFPNYSQVSPSISDLESFYKESKKRFDEDPEFKKRAYSCVVKLQAFDTQMIQAWQLICDVSKKEFSKIYNRLDVKIIERGESFYQQRMESLVKELESKGVLEEDEGRKILWGETIGEGIPFTMVKSGGGFTYDTSDVACLKHRLQEDHANWVIYVTDAGQSLHIKTLFSCARRLGILTSDHRMDHVTFGVVLGEDKKKFKTRSGETIKLNDLLDEGLKRALDKLVSKGRDKVLSPEELQAAQESVAYGCIRYADLSHNRNHEYVFSFDKMLEDKGNTAVYLLYALTRIRSIARNANISTEKMREAVENTLISLEEDKEWKLAKVLLKFPDVLNKITKEWYLHILCEYCYEISCAFTEFYDTCYCVEKNKDGEVIKVNMGRILLTEVTAIMMEQCFYLLGLKPVTRM